MNKSKWLAYTVLVALIPMAARLIVWLVLRGQSIPAVASSDIVAFGLVLSISVINEIEHLQGNNSWKTIQNGIAIMFIALYGVVYAVLLVGERNTQLIDNGIVLWCVSALAAASLVLSLTVLQRLSAARSGT